MSDGEKKLCLGPCGEMKFLNHFTPSNSSYTTVSGEVHHYYNYNHICKSCQREVKLKREREKIKANELRTI